MAGRIDRIEICPHCGGAEGAHFEDCHFPTTTHCDLVAIARTALNAEQEPPP